MREIMKRCFAVGLAVICAAQIVSAQEYRAPASSSAGLPTLQRITVTILASQIATLHSAPVTIVPAGGANTIVGVVAAHISKSSGTGWTTAGSGGLVIAYAGALTIAPVAVQGGAGSQQAGTTAFLGSSSAQFGVYEPGAGDISFVNFGFDSANTAACFNSAIVLYLGSANISGGTGTLTVTVWYRVWPQTIP